MGSTSRPTLSDRQRLLLNRVIALLEAEAVNTPSPVEIAGALVIPIQAVQGILRLGVHVGELVKLGDSVYYTPGQLATLREVIVPDRAAPPNSVADLRKRLNTTRKYAEPLFEMFCG